MNERKFESIVKGLILSGELKNLYDSEKWDHPTSREKNRGRKPRYKNHRG